MNNECFYKDDEGISVNLIFDACGEYEVQVIYLESEVMDEKLVNEIDSILKNQEKIFSLLKKEILLYIDRNYKNGDFCLKLMKIYVFPDIENELGFIFRWNGDTEHGIGVRMSGLSVKKIGSAEMAFL
ncbi:hypothetical protein [Pectobacterium sp. B1J-3]|uniref:hypothetical protein n=1 Tax=Pectobacterium sp. B1J-3 TaxID=3385371 RepID=UPI003906C7B4